jgi:hypothetical protein
MAILSSELSIGELTALLCAVILTLIPLTIGSFAVLKAEAATAGSGPDRNQSEQKSIRELSHASAPRFFIGSQTFPGFIPVQAPFNHQIR